MAELIKQSLWFPAIQSVHIIGLTMLVGTICLIGLRGRPVGDLASTLAPWTSGGLLTVLVTGPLLFGSDLTRYLSNPAFVVKMLLLAAALTGHFTLHRSVVRNDGMTSPARRKIVAILSLIVWS